MATISSHHARACLGGLQARGYSAEAVLVKAGINPVSLQEVQRLHTEQVARLFRQVQLHLNDEFMGFTRRPCKLGAFATYCELVSRCATVGELLAKACSFYSLLTDDFRLSLREKEGVAIFEIELASPELDPDNFWVEYLLVIWHRFPSWFVGEAIPLKETAFTIAPPAHRDELQIMFPGPNRFRCQRNRLCFDARLLDKPLLRSERELLLFLERAPSDFMTIPGEDHSLEAQIEKLVVDSSRQRLQFPPLDEIAAQLGVSAKTLHRRLQKSGTSYQKIKDDIRREVAIRKLVKERLSVDEVSEIVGFAEARSFTRAFKQWTGLSPRHYCQYQR